MIIFRLGKNPKSHVKQICRKKRFCALIALNSLLTPMGKERKLHLGRATNAQDAWIWFHRNGTLERKCPGKTVTIVTLLFPGPQRIIIEK
jgi:hypothetical protein